jgi:hypothetical protein
MRNKKNPAEGRGFVRYRGYRLTETDQYFRYSPISLP